MAETTSQVCTQHRHRPQPTYSELHHVIPQAWQAFWQPPQPWPFPGRSPDRRNPDGSVLLLWDARTIPLCRTGHGNVHFWLVRAMRAYSPSVGDDLLAPIDEAWKLVRGGARRDGLTIAKPDMVIARQAMERWQDAGGWLISLSHAGLYGEI